jgi:hypothetical protein
MTACLPKGSKVFELLEGGAAAREPGRRKLNVFARWVVELGLMGVLGLRLKCSWRWQNSGVFIASTPEACPV